MFHVKHFPKTTDAPQGKLHRLDKRAAKACRSKKSPPSSVRIAKLPRDNGAKIVCGIVVSYRKSAAREIKFCIKSGCAKSLISRYREHRFAQTLGDSRKNNKPPGSRSADKAQPYRRKRLYCRSGKVKATGRTAIAARRDHFTLTPQEKPPKIRIIPGSKTRTIACRFHGTADGYAADGAVFARRSICATRAQDYM